MEKGVRTILVIEDSPAQALEKKLFLDEYGFNVLLAGDGKEGSQMALDHLPDLILLDIELPDMDGFAICKVLKENPATAGIPIVIHTILEERLALLSGIDLGAVDYIPKDSFWQPVLLGTLRELNLLEGPVREEEDDGQG
jgi:DNA-binding response OmpR family regulator